MLPLIFLAAGIGAALAFAGRRDERAPAATTSSYPSGYELHAYKTSRGEVTETTLPSLDEARARAEALIAQGFDKVAVRYVPAGYVPGDSRAQEKPSVHFAHPSDYNPWQPKSPRDRDAPRSAR